MNMVNRNKKRWFCFSILFSIYQRKYYKFLNFLILLFTNYSFEEKTWKRFKFIIIHWYLLLCKFLEPAKIATRNAKKNENFEFKKCQYLTNFLYNIPFWFKVVIVEDYIEFSWTKHKSRKGLFRIFRVNNIVMIVEPISWFYSIFQTFIFDSFFSIFSIQFNCILLYSLLNYFFQIDYQEQ